MSMKLVRINIPESHIPWKAFHVEAYPFDPLLPNSSLQIKKKVLNTPEEIGCFKTLALMFVALFSSSDKFRHDNGSRK
jgi:hypothetical protein